MAKETEPKTYRISPEVDGQLRRLAKIHGGIDRALRHMLTAGGVFKSGCVGSESNPLQNGDCITPEGIIRPFVDLSRRRKQPLLKPSQQRKKQ
jgi:hypothetical protein